jgi:hypothetical protein
MVAERICRIPLEDLKTIRITCKKCGRTAETTIEDAADMLVGSCNLCRDRFFDIRGSNDPIGTLATAIRRFGELRDKFSVEFVISDPEGKAG